MDNYAYAFGPAIPIMLSVLARHVQEARVPRPPAPGPATPALERASLTRLSDLRAQYFEERSGTRSHDEVRALLPRKSWQEVAHERPDDPFARAQAAAEHRCMMRSLQQLAQVIEMEQPGHGHFAGPWVGEPD